MHFANRLDRFSHCVLVPYVTADPDGFVIFDGFIEGLGGPEPRAASVKAIREAARRIPQLGLVERGSLELAQQRTENLEQMLAEANAALETAEAKLDRVNGFAKDGYKVVRQQGRPPVKPKVEA